MRIYLTSGAEVDKPFSLEGETVSVGRSPQNDIQIKDRFVSRKHLRIYKRDDRWFAVDLNSRNGTFINGEPIAPGVEFELTEGSPVVIGMSVLCLGMGCSEKILQFLNASDLSGPPVHDLSYHSEERKISEQRNMELVYQVCDVLTASMGMEECLKKILSFIFDLLLRIDRGVIILVESDTGVVKEIVSRSKKGEDDLPYSKDVVDRVLRFKEAFMVADVDTAEEDFPDTLKIIKIKSVMCVPLICRGRLQGVLYVDSVDKPYGFRGEDLFLLNALSSPIAMAIENAILTRKAQPTEGIEQPSGYAQ